jgi:hypothetical protein
MTLIVVPILLIKMIIVDHSAPVSLLDVASTEVLSQNLAGGLISGVAFCSSRQAYFIFFIAVFGWFVFIMCSKESFRAPSAVTFY